MKIINPAAYALVCLLAHVTGVSAKRDFTPPDHGSGSGKRDHVKTSANFDDAGAKMEVCPTGDCSKGKFMRLTVTSLGELDSTGKDVSNKTLTLTDFNTTDASWTNITTVLIDGVNISSTSYVSTFTVGEDSVLFNLTASIPEANATLTYGSQTITVPAGALKFTVDITGWKFENTDNSLALAISLDAKGPNGKKLGKPEKKPKGHGPNSTIERVDMGDSMFMDAPTIVILDDKETNVTNSSVVEDKDGVSFQWVFPSFQTSLHYDPVLGDDSSSSSSSGSGGTTTTSGSSGTTTSGGTTATSSAPVISFSSLAVVTLTAIAYSLF
ncbi:Multidrug resistance-associated protein 1 [Phytophthora cinnamomi]|uniref:Multidrug resistance-associated protein 1 n=1 Tax=Phytophthora cinnamomi TaxID=4785 RepID=UPI003559B3EA|nr:Multidrug resistance-associated protein 1 [Phytophthora cinnamomi]